MFIKKQIIEDELWEEEEEEEGEEEDEEGDELDGIDDPKTLREMIKKKDEEIEKLNEKDTNFQKIRGAKGESDKKAAELADQLKRAEENASEKTLEILTNSWRDEAVSGLAGDDEELQKKILASYERLKDTVETKDEVANKVEEAYLFVTSKESKADILKQSGIVSSAGSSPSKAEAMPQLKDKDKEAIKAFGISDEEVTKYYGKTAEDVMRNKSNKIAKAKE